MSSLIGVGVIGCGFVGRTVHIPALRSMRGVRLIAAADPDPAARALAARLVPGLSVVDDATRLLSTAGVDAVVIASPPGCHVTSVLESFAAGKHVYLEKPMAATSAEARRMRDARKASGLVGMLGFNFRFHPLLRQLREAVADGRAGSIAVARSAFAIAPRTLVPWRTERANGGGALLELGSHHFDLVRFLFGADVERVFAHVSSARADDDTATLELRLTNGVVVQSFFSLSAADQDQWMVYGTKGTLTVDRFLSEDVEFTATGHMRARLDRARYSARRLLSVRSYVDKLRAPMHEPSFVRALAAFVRVIHDRSDDDPLRPGFDDGYRAMAIVDAAESSVATGQEAVVRYA